MASVRETPGGKFELCLRHKLLAKRVYLTFDSRELAAQYGAQCDALLRGGVVPAGLVVDVARPSERLSIMLLAWINSGAPAKSDLEVLALLSAEVGTLRLDQLSYTWALGWVQNYKLVANYAPGTIRKRVGALSRCLDDYMRRHPDVVASNPLRLLPRGTASYNAQDAAQAVALGKRARVDVERDRRLHAGEFDRIMAALQGVKRPDRERALVGKDAAYFKLLFLLIYYTGVRLREAYRVRVDQIDMRRRSLQVQSSKQWHGRMKHRDIPMRPEFHAALTAHLAAHEYAPGALLLPFWDGTEPGLDAATSRLSDRFRKLFDYAQCAGLTEHDLRHETTCQWYELRGADGHWLFREKEIDKIMGWVPGSKMAARYASFRAESLAERMYARPAAVAAT